MDRNIALFCMIGSIAIGLITIVRTLILIIKKGLDNKTAFKIIRWCKWKL